MQGNGLFAIQIMTLPPIEFKGAEVVSQGAQLACARFEEHTAIRQNLCFPSVAQMGNWLCKSVKGLQDRVPRHSKRSTGHRVAHTDPGAWEGSIAFWLP